MNLNSTGLTSIRKLQATHHCRQNPFKCVKSQPRGTRQLCSASASAVRGGEKLESVRADIARLAGSKNGTDRSPEEKAHLNKLALSLGDLNIKEKLNMTGSKWKLVYTESTASSAGKLGPFVGRVVQEFPADKPNQYINWLYLGPATISLLADYKQEGDDKIVVSFQYIQVELGIWKWRKELKNQGTWDSIYINDDYRVFKANQKNVFVLEKIAA